MAEVQTETLPIWHAQVRLAQHADVVHGLAPDESDQPFRQSRSTKASPPQSQCFTLTTTTASQKPHHSATAVTPLPLSATRGMPDAPWSRWRRWHPSAHPIAGSYLSKARA